MAIRPTFSGRINGAPRRGLPKPVQRSPKAGRPAGGIRAQPKVIGVRGQASGGTGGGG